MDNVFAFENSQYKYCVWALGWMGYWPWRFTNRLAKLSYKILEICSPFIMIYLYVKEIVGIIIIDKSNLAEFVKLISSLALHWPSITKVFFWLIFRNKLIKLMEYIEAKGNIYDEQSLRDMFREYKYEGVSSSKLYIYILALAMNAYFLPSLLIGIFDSIMNPGKKCEKEQLPFLYWSPLRIDTPPLYSLEVAQQYFLALYYGSVFIGIDTMIANIMFTIKAHIRCLQVALATIHERSERQIRQLPFTERQHSEEMDILKQVKVKKLKICIRHLLSIFRASSELENLQNLLLLNQYLASMFTVSISLYVLSMETEFSASTVARLCFVMLVVAQPYFFCWCGNEITHEFENIQPSWQSDWVDSGCEYQKLMLITMMRLNRPLLFTFGKFTTLGATCFLQVLKVSYSFFAMLRSTNH